jgi:hypothetical protein
VCGDGWLIEFESSGILLQVAMVKGYSSHYRSTAGENQGNNKLVTGLRYFYFHHHYYCLYWIIYEPVLRPEVFLI